MTFLHFTENQFWPLAISCALLIGSVLFFNTGRLTISLSLLFLGSLALGFFIANLDPFLILWDEQYHALVAKSMMKDPFRPMLYAVPVLEYDYTNWSANHIWVHKQPLFLWQMALSLKLFGVNEMAIRIPSIVMHAFAALMIYRIGKISVSADVGYYGALFFTLAYFPLEMVAG
ncbi:MAG: ArnT family glycosyltransferase, partial [Bacteroidia bacterium]